MNQIQSSPLVQKTVCAKSLELDNQSHMPVPTEHGVDNVVPNRSAPYRVLSIVRAPRADRKLKTTL
jgi:hypothetical protein